MKVLYDYQVFDFQRFGGISRLYFELIRHYLQEEYEIQPKLGVLTSENEYLKGLASLPMAPSKKITLHPPGLKRKCFKELDRRTGKSFFSRKLTDNREESIRQLRQGDFDLFHPTYYDPYFLDHLQGKPYVLTVHDMIHEIYPEYFPIGHQEKTQEIFQRAAGILTISESTKRDLTTLYDIPEEKIKVVYLASDLRPEKEFKISVQLPENYVLFVGNRENYKNFYFLATVFSRLSRRHPDLYLVCTGKSFDAREEKFLQNLGIRDRVVQVFVHDPELSYLYTHARCFVFPSLYEGFGIPVLEAYHHDCPTLLADTSSLTEIAGDGAVFFQPKNIGDCLTKLEDLIVHNQAWRDRLIPKARQIRQQFSWEKSAKETADFYRHLLNRRA